MGTLINLGWFWWNKITIARTLKCLLKQSVLHLEEDKRLACNKIISQSLCFMLIQRADL